MKRRNLFPQARLVAIGADPEEYHKQIVDRGDLKFVISHSHLVEIGRCPARWRAGYEPSDSEAKENGRLVDTLFLTPQRFYESYIEYPETYRDSKTGEPKPWNNRATVCKQWKAEYPGKEFVWHDETLSARIAVRRLREDEIASGVMVGARTQVHIEGVYEDRTTRLEIPVKALLDIVPPADGPFGKFLLDFKTSRSGAAHFWQRQVFNMSLHAQAAFHSDLYVAATGEDRCVFGHIVQENYPPYHVERRMLSSEYLELGRGQYLAALQLYAQCLKTNQWPGYFAEPVVDGFQIISPEAWMMMQAFRTIEVAAPDLRSQEQEDLIP